MDKPARALRSIRAPRLGLLLASAGFAGIVATTHWFAMPAMVQASDVAAPRPGASSPTLRWAIDETTAFVGQTRMVALEVVRPAIDASQPAGEGVGTGAPARDRPFVVASADPDTIAVITPPTQLITDGRHAFVRIVALRPGLAELRVASIDGAAATDATGSLPTIRVRTLTPDDDPAGSLWLEQRTPRITSPLAGATVWDGVNVCVEWMDDPVNALTGQPIEREVWLEVDGQRLAPSAVTPADRAGLTRRASFTIEPAARTDAPPEGVIRTLVPRARWADHAGVWRDVTGASVRLREISPIVTSDNTADDAASASPVAPAPRVPHVRVIEAESLVDAARPRRFGLRRIPVEQNAGASGGAFTSHPSNDPPLSITFRVAEPSWYQVMALVSGDEAGQALPTLGLVIDDADNAATAGRLTRAGTFERVAVGLPIRLTEGWRTVSIRFENDFGGGGQDRNVRLDRVELVRLDGPISMPWEETREVEPGPEDGMIPAAALAHSLQQPDPLGLTTRPLRVALDRPIDGMTIVRPTSLSVQLLPVPPANTEVIDRPIVTLSINGREVFATPMANARLPLMPEWLDSGQNLVQVIARDSSGREARSASHRVFFPGEQASRDDAPQLLWPAPGERLFREAAAIARYTGTTPAREAEVIIDDQPTGIIVPVRWTDGLVHLPLPLRDIRSGSVRIACELRLVDGRSIRTPSVVAEVLQRRPERPTRYEQAVRVLDRMGFGPSPRDLTSVLLTSPEAWLEAQLTAPASASLAPLDAAATRYPGRRSYSDIAARVLQQAAQSSVPARERATLFVQNHLSTWARKVEPDRKWIEHVTFSRLGASAFPDLLMASATSPAMIRYLDQQRSFARSLNENYARELLELHTLGVDAGYTQDDVTALARVLTGWSLSTEGEPHARDDRDVRAYELRFEPRLNDGRAERIMGVDLPRAETPSEKLERIIVILELLAAHPTTARFVCTKLAATFGPPGLDTDRTLLINAMTRRWLQTNGDLRSVLAVLAASDELLMSPEAAPRLCTPTDFIVRLLRAIDADAPAAGPAQGFLTRSRMGVFDNPTPDGYPPHDSAWADSNAMLQRWRIAREFAPALAATLPESLRAGEASTSTELDSAWRQRVIDLLAIRITGRLLGDRSNAAAMALHESADAPGSPSANSAEAQPAQSPGTREELARDLAALVASLPEANTR